MVKFLKELWVGWKRIAAKIAHVQGNILLGVIYLVVVMPLGLLFRLFGQDPLEIRGISKPSYWVRRPSLKSSADFMKRQF